MGKVDGTVNQMMERKEVFADFINGVVYGGRKIIHPESLELLRGQNSLAYEGEHGYTNVLERKGDIRMQADMGTYSVIFADENQNKVHYAMPLRNMLYDALEYTRQVQNLEKKNRESGGLAGSREFLSGMKKEDRLAPIVTMIFYSGDDWDGAKSLSEMMNLGDGEEAEVLKTYLPDYKIHLVSAETVKDPNVFSGCLQHIFSMLKFKKDKKKLYEYIKENRKEIQGLDSVERTAAMVLLGEQKRLLAILNEKENEEEKGEPDVCQAIDELIEDGRIEGKKEGKIEGKVEGRKEMILELLDRLGKISESVKKQLDKEDNLDTLKAWSKLAMDAKTMEEFEQAIR